MKVQYFGKCDSHTVLIQPVGSHDFPFITDEINYIKLTLAMDDFLFVAVQVDDWNHDLSPWQAPPIWGNDSFGEGAAETLVFIEREVVEPLNAIVARDFYIGGYSLAGLFALWAAYNTKSFSGVAAVSPSVWFPGFVDFSRENELKAGKVYLSLGDKEEKTRNQVMATVGTAICAIHAYLSDSGVPTVLEWNKGNHFNEPELRMAKGFEWILS